MFTLEHNMGAAALTGELGWPCRDIFVYGTSLMLILGLTAIFVVVIRAILHKVVEEADIQGTEEVEQEADSEDENGYVANMVPPHIQLENVDCFHTDENGHIMLYIRKPTPEEEQQGGLLFKRVHNKFVLTPKTM